MGSRITIERMNEADIADTSRVFLDELLGAYASFLGFDYLAKLYFPYLLQYPKSVSLVLKIDGKVAGFILGAKAKGFYGDFLRTQFLPFLWYNLLCFLKNPLITVKEIINIFSVTKNDPALPDAEQTAELLYMAVSKNFQRSNHGAALVKRFEEELKKQGYQQCLVQTMQSTPHAQNFYSKNSYVECQRGNGRIWFLKHLN